MTELLFLYECKTQPVTTLRAVASRLGLTVQAVSHLYRELARRGWVEVRNHQYLLTVSGTAALQGTLSALEDEIGHRLEQLQIVRTTVAVARRAVAKGEVVSLELEEGLLTAVPGGSGSSRGRARTPAGAGNLVEVDDLQGIVPIAPGAISVLVVPRSAVGQPTARRSAAAAIRREGAGLVVAQGLEAIQLARQATAVPVGRFGAAAACLEASRLGVDSVAFVTEEELPRFLAPLAGPSPPPVTVARLR